MTEQRKIKNCCENCKHDDMCFLKEPCFSCRCENGKQTNFQPKSRLKIKNEMPLK